jgi:glycosyltransferase involved in cell wall biosynthesis
MISFIIPYYNVPLPLLDRCIRSITTQDLKEEDYEIIVIDDESELSPQEVIGHYKPINIRLIRQPHGGLSAARNRGIKEAKGIYLEFIDADDFLFPYTICPCLEVLENSGADIVTFGYKNVFTASDEVKDEECQKPTNFQKLLPCRMMAGTDFVKSHNLLVEACLYIFRRQLAVDEGIEFPLGIYHEDEIFTPLLFVSADRIAETRCCAYGYYQRPDSIVHQTTDKHTEKRFEDVKYIILHLLHTADTMKGDKGDALQIRAMQLCMNFFYLTVRDEALAPLREPYIAWLRQNHLYPFIHKHATRKYRILAILANNRRWWFIIKAFARFR